MHLNTLYLTFSTQTPGFLPVTGRPRITEALTSSSARCSSGRPATTATELQQHFRSPRFHLLQNRLPKTVCLHGAGGNQFGPEVGMNETPGWSGWTGSPWKRSDACEPDTEI